MSNQWGMDWGALDLAAIVPPDTEFQIEAMAGGSSLGNPEAQFEVVRSLLTDGSLVTLEGWDNRTVTIYLRFSAPRGVAGPALAAAEAAVMAQVRATSKPDLVWTPPAQDAKPCAFDVVAADLERDDSDGWDQEEEMREYRYFTLTLTCLPFAKDVEPTIVAAVTPPPTTPTTVVIDDVSSLSGWSLIKAGGTTATGPSIDGGMIWVEGGSPNANSLMGLRRTGVVNMGATPYLVLDVYILSVADVTPIRIDGVEQEVLASYYLPDGFERIYIKPPATFSTIDFLRWGPFSYDVLGCVRVARTDALPTSGTARQQVRTTNVLGTVPTQATIRLFDATPAALGGEILVYTSTNRKWEPPLRPFMTSPGGSATMPDSNRVSGGRNVLSGTPVVYRIPASRITSGTYDLLALMSNTTNGTLSWSMRTVSVSGTTTLGSSVTMSGSVALAPTSGYQVQRLAKIPLPILAVEGNQMIELTITGTANMILDEAWLFATHDGVLSWLRDGDSMSWVEARSPELGAARPSFFGGTAAKGAGGANVDWKVEAFGTHRFEPGPMQVLTVCTTSLLSQCELQYFARYHSHVEGSAAA